MNVIHDLVFVEIKISQSFKYHDTHDPKQTNKQTWPSLSEQHPTLWYQLGFWFVFCCCNKQHYQKQCGDNELILCILYSTSSKEAKTRIWSRNNGGTLFTYLLVMDCSTSSLNTLILIINEESAPTDMPQGHSDGSHSSIKVLWWFYVTEITNQKYLEKYNETRIIGKLRKTHIEKKVFGFVWLLKINETK